MLCNPVTTRRNVDPLLRVNRLILRVAPFGPIVLFWIRIKGSPRIVRILLSKPGSSALDRAFRIFPDFREESCREINATIRKIKAFLSGDVVAFPLDLVDWTCCTAFQKSVLHALCKIPRGSIGTYQFLARQLGRKKGARAVGNALARNPFPLMVPCHRAIRSNRYPGDFQGGAKMKRNLLEKEGIVFDKANRANFVKFRFNEKGEG